MDTLNNSESSEKETVGCAQCGHPAWPCSADETLCGIIVHEVCLLDHVNQCEECKERSKELDFQLYS
jgi:hypothetical protein